MASVECTSCGEKVDHEDAVWARHGDRPEDGREWHAFPLHADCYDRDRRVTVAEWLPSGREPTDEYEKVTTPDHRGQPFLQGYRREMTVERYKEATKAQVQRELERRGID